MEQIELEFIGKKKTYTHGAGADVSLTVACKGAAKQQLSFVFRNGCAKKITPVTGYYVIAISGARLYFKEADNKTGYKITQGRTKNDYSTMINEKLLPWARIHEGDFALQFDNAAGLYFIEDSRQWITKGGAT